MSDADVESYCGHQIPPFSAVFPKVFRAGVEIMSLEQIDAVATALSDADRQLLGNTLGPSGVEQVIDGLAADKAERLASHYGAVGDPDPEAFRRLYPRLAVTTNNALSVDQLRAMLDALSAEELASQSLYFGDQGRIEAFSALDPKRVETILDHTDDWVLLLSGKSAAQGLSQYTATLEKQERLDRKLQGKETITLKVRREPRASYLKWLAGPFKGREVLYNAALFGADKLRVREAGLLGVMPVTIGLESPVARRGTKHRITEVGLLPLVELIEQDYQKAAPHGDIQRRNHGITELDGHRVYRMESILPRDPSKGYYCHRMMHYTDYVHGLEIKAEIYGFDNQLGETFSYQSIDPAPALTDADFDPKNRAYRL